MNRSLIMADWSRQDEPTYRRREDFIWHQLLLSLLYDNVWARDETILLSNKLASWFSDAQDFQTFAKLAECGAIGFIKRPVANYPRELQNEAESYPITARRKYLEQFSAYNDGRAATFSPRQLIFQDRLSVLLRELPSVHRFGGVYERPSEPNLMVSFASLLREVLTDPRYAPWLRGKYKCLERKDLDSFLQAMDSRQHLVDRLRSKNIVVPYRYDDPSHGAVFNVGIAMQLAVSFDGKKAQAFQELIISAFSELYCQREMSDGRFGSKLRELPKAHELMDDGRVPDIRIVRVEVITLRLPAPDADLPKIVHEIRDRPSGRKLRKAMLELGSETAFSSAVSAWNEVAEDLASRVSSKGMKEVGIQTVVGESGKGIFTGVLAAIATSWGSGHEFPSLLDMGAHAAAGGIVDVGGNLARRVISYPSREKERAKLSEALRGAFSVSACTRQSVIPAAGESH